MNKQLIDRLIEKNGRNKELIVCMEECAELIQAISKFIRYEWNDEYAGTFNLNRDNLVEEMADVKICLQILQSAFDIQDKDLENMEQIKEDRLKFRYKLKEKNL